VLHAVRLEQDAPPAVASRLTCWTRWAGTAGSSHRNSVNKACSRWLVVPATARAICSPFLQSISANNPVTCRSKLSRPALRLKWGAKRAKGAATSAKGTECAFFSIVSSCCQEDIPR
jgi:hypothetical protein